MARPLQIYNRRERFLVRGADAVLDAASLVLRPLAGARPDGPPRRILLLRLERIGDLLMTLGAMAAVRSRAPEASIHLVIGSWNADLAPLIASVDSVETLDVPWLARSDGGVPPFQLMRRAVAWRTRRFDLGLNFEPDIRTNTLLALSGAARRVGFFSGGGGALLSDALEFDPQQHTAANAMRIVDCALAPSPSLDAGGGSALVLSQELQRQAAELLEGGGERLIGLHANGGRLVKQWHLDRLAETGARLARELNGRLVLTGTAGEQALVGELASLIPGDVPVTNVAGRMNLPLFAAVLARLTLFVTPDTGPMHLAAAVGTPTVALFGPSDPARYGPLSPRARVVTAPLWCRPCNRVRLPPERCTGHVPDCLDRISVEMVHRAARELASTSS